MNLAFLIHAWFPWGGQQRDFLRIARACHERGHTLRVYTMKWEGEPPPWLDIRHVPVKAMTRHRLYQRFSARVEQALQQEPVDCVVGFSRMPGLDVYFAADPCFADKVRYERPRIYRLTPRCRHFLAFEQAVFGRDSHTRVLLVSPQQRERYLAWYPDSRQRLELLPPGLSEERRPPSGAEEREHVREELRRALGLGEAHHLLLQVGSGFRIKGVDRALRAVAALPPETRDLTRYIVLGRDRPDRFLRLARRLGISDNCLFPGGRDDVQRFMLGADLLLHPAYRESAGHALLEAVINGLPVLTTDTCGYAFHVRQAQAGEVCASPFEQQELNRRLRRMLADRSARRRWSGNGLRYGRDEDLYRMPEAAADCIERCAAQRREGAG